MVDGGGWKKSEDDANDEGDETQTNVVEAFVDAAVVVRLAAAAMSDVVDEIQTLTGLHGARYLRYGV